MQVISCKLTPSGRGLGSAPPCEGVAESPSQNRLKPIVLAAARARRGGWGYAPNPSNPCGSWFLELGTPYVCRSLCQGTAHTESVHQRGQFSRELPQRFRDTESISCSGLTCGFQSLFLSIKTIYMPFLARKSAFPVRRGQGKGRWGSAPIDPMPSLSFGSTAASTTDSADCA